MNDNTMTKVEDNIFEYAAEHLPAGYKIAAFVEKDAAWVEWFDPAGIRHAVYEDETRIPELIKIAHRACKRHDQKT